MTSRRSFLRGVAGLLLLVSCGAGPLSAQGKGKPQPPPPPGEPMGISYLCGFEMGSLGEVHTTFGTTPSVQSSVVHSGSYALQCSGSANSSYVQFTARASGGTARNLFQSARFTLRLGSLPATQTSIWGISDLLVNLIVGAVAVNPNGTLYAFSASGADATSTNALSADGLWHSIQVDNGWNAGAGLNVYVDGTLWISIPTGSPTAQPSGLLGWLGVTSATLYLDDIVWYDGSLPKLTPDWNLALLTPISDNTVGTGWLDGDGAGTLFGSVDNLPPVGIAVAANGTQIKNATSTTTGNYDANCKTYQNAGIGPFDTINAVQAIVNHGMEGNTNARAGAVVIVSNPSGQSELSFDWGDAGGADVGTFPTNWATAVGPVTSNPSVTLTTSPVVRVGKRTATARQTDVDFMGIYVDYSPAPAFVRSRRAEDLIASWDGPRQRLKRQH